jgi:predicted O-methyltransferase YrrM
MELRFTADWFSANIPHWQKHLGHLAGKPDLHCIEVGCLEGRSTCWLLQNILTHPSCTITCIDLFELGEEHFAIVRDFPGALPVSIPIAENFQWNIRVIGAEEKVRTMKGRSEEMLRMLPVSCYDIAYIDGSHTARNVLMDIVLSWSLLKQDGIMILDDYEWPCFPDQPLRRPKIAIDAFLSVFEGEYAILQKEYQVIVRKTVPSPSSSMEWRHALKGTLASN